jgi:hypothetical protein
MNTNTEKDAVLERLRNMGVASDASTLSSINGGANNQVFRMDEQNGEPLLIKVYFWHPADQRDRLGTEFNFSSYLWNCGIHEIPQPITRDRSDRIGVYKFITGETFDKSPIGQDEIEQATLFFRRINACRNNREGRSLPSASEACFTIRDHLNCVARRLHRISLLVTEDDISSTVIDFVRSRLAPAWEQVQKKAIHAAGDIETVLPEPERCLSPSDFGFHNAIRRSDGRICFLDFEYAGWDDPAKTICDFFCQPKIPAPMAFFEEFTADITDQCASPKQTTTRAHLLFPVYVIKWTCIMLNEFLPVARQRRRHAGIGREDNSLLTSQFKKARSYFDDKFPIQV